MIKHISVVIIVKNGAQTLSKTLDSIRAFEDVIVYDNGSTDASLSIASSYANVTLHQGDFFGFGETKNLAASLAKNDWIFSLDCDEVVSAELLKNLQKTIFNNTFVYEVFRNNYYNNKRIMYCGWGKESIPRIYNRIFTSFTDSMVHEKILTKDLSLMPIYGELMHHPYASLSDFIIKADRYSSLYATNNVGKKKSSPSKAFFNGLYSFVRTYVLKRGFLDGWVGLVIAFSHMVTNFFKYMKLYEANKEAGYQ
jgi:glycosyltransferase involved in cell wall biosynthesis